MVLPDFLTHYYEEERGPFRNICDLSDLGFKSWSREKKKRPLHSTVSHSVLSSGVFDDSPMIS